MMCTIFALAVLFLCFVLDSVDAFGVTHSSLSIRQKVVACVPPLTVQKDDAYDDFYAGFNPAEFETYNQGYNKPQPRRSNNRNVNGHDYVRDWDADDSNVDVLAVNQLIAERLSMRKTGQFEEADDIRDRLLNEHGVLVRDKDKKWRSGCSRSGSGLKWLRASTSDRRSNSKPVTDYGPNGHDYVMAIDASEFQCKLSVEDINKLLAERLGRKLSRDYKGADKLQEELLKAGVFVNDRSREWRADGKSFLGLEPNQYTMSELSEKPDESMLEEIESLIKVRALLKAERLFKGADTVRDDLVYRYNVYVDDRSLQWSVGNPFPGEKKWGNEYVPFRMARSSQIPDEVDEIEALLEERDSSRVNRNFKKADEIRDRLANEFNVYTNDKKREWSVGRIKKSRSESRESFEPRGFTQRGGGSLPEEDLAKVNQLLIERRSLKRERRFDEADAIRDQLIEDYGISVDDRNSEWRFRNAPYSVADDSKAVDEQTQMTIQDMVESRVRAREARDFETADSIRNELETNYSVIIDDRLREWYVEQ